MKGQQFRDPRMRASVSGVRVRPEGPEEPGDALRARSKMRGGRLFRVGASRLMRTPDSVVAPQAPDAEWQTHRGIVCAMA